MAAWGTEYGEGQGRIHYCNDFLPFPPYGLFLSLKFFEFVYLFFLVTCNN